jgi:hypothetical protein
MTLGEYKAGYDKDSRISRARVAVSPRQWHLVTQWARENQIYWATGEPVRKEQCQELFEDGPYNLLYLSQNDRLVRLADGFTHNLLPQPAPKTPHYLLDFSKLIPGFEPIEPPSSAMAPMEF